MLPLDENPNFNYKAIPSSRTNASPRVHIVYSPLLLQPVVDGGILQADKAFLHRCRFSIPSTHHGNTPLCLYSFHFETDKTQSYKDLYTVGAYMTQAH